QNDQHQNYQLAHPGGWHGVVYLIAYCKGNTIRLTLPPTHRNNPLTRNYCHPSDSQKQSG
ncbi:MAG: hypothetical protein PUB53_04335, partial [Bacteroidales bacterium]|nr:hypothetical protein [Bacteroidales bacterium]